MALGGCSAAPIEAEDLCTRLTRTLCEGNVPCCDVDRWTYDDVESCIDDNLDLCERVLGRDSASAGFSYDAAAAGELEAAIAASAASCEAVPPMGLESYYGRAPEEPREGLAGVFEPLLEVGDACGGTVASYACGAGLECHVDSDAGLGGEGACDPRSPPGEEGSPCSAGLASTSVGCAGGLVCAGCLGLLSPGCDDASGIGDGFCRVSGALGDPCGRGTCTSPGYCNLGLGSSAGTCAPALPEGAACLGHNECAGGHCEGADLDVGGGHCGDEPPARSHCRVWQRRIG